MERVTTTNRDQTEDVATRVLDRWKMSGFDTLLCHPSGFCSPANSGALAAVLRDGYRVYPIDSSDAHRTLARAIDGGMPYRS